MALSFEESKRLAAKAAQSAVATSLAATPKIQENEIDIPVYDISTLAVNPDAGFERSGKYTWYENYTDDKYSIVDENKDIQLDDSQINITQENNSQVIPFEMPRFYDGIDLMDMTIQMHYLNANKEENYSSPINVSFSADKIRFYWLVSNDATAKEGELQFEIMASGAVSVPSTDTTKNYLWRTRPNGKLNILKSLTGKQMADPTGNDWYTQFLATMSQKVGEAQVAADQAKQAAQDAKDAVAGVDEKLANFYNKTEVDGFITLLREDLAKVDGLANFAVEYDPETQVIKFKNGDKDLTSITLTTDPSASWVTAYNKTVEAKIDEKLSPIQTELTETKESLDELKTEIGDLPNTLQSDYYNKEATDKLLDAKADKTSIEGFNNELNVVKKNIDTVQSTVDTANADIAQLQEDIKNIKGIGDKMYEKMAPYLTV